MTSYVVDPAAKTVEPYEPDGEEDFLDAVRREIGVPQLAVMPVSGGAAAVWTDQMGLLKPDRWFWRFTDSSFRFAGRSLITAISPNGLPMGFPKEDIEVVRAAIVFEPPETLLRIEEAIVVVRDEETGSPVPSIARRVIWKDEEKPAATAEAAPAMAAGWTVFERDAGGYRAIQYELRGEALEASQMVSAGNLEDLRAKLPQGLQRRDPTDVDAPEVVEHWL